MPNSGIETNFNLPIGIKNHRIMAVIRRLQQFFIGVVAALSLLASSSSACTCSHHEIETKSETSACHHPSDVSEIPHAGDSGFDSLTYCSASDTDCVCTTETAKFLAKSETIKLNKYILRISTKLPKLLISIRQQDTEGVDLVKPFNLSDSFYDLAPKRGPPVL